MSHDAHVIRKAREGGDRDGEVTYYAVGPTRGTLEEARAERDLFLDQAARIATLERELQEERARGAVRCLRLKEARAALDTLPPDALGSGRTSDGEEYSIRDEMIHYITQAIGGDDSAAQALLELAEASTHYRRHPSPESRRRWDEAVDRWLEVSRG